MNIAPEEMPREIARLKEENSMLKDCTKELEERINKAVEHIVKDYTKELQDRIDKAIEQCKQDIKDIWKWEGACTEMFEEIVDILKGSDKE